MRAPSAPLALVLVLAFACSREEGGGAATGAGGDAAPGDAAGAGDGAAPPGGGPSSWTMLGGDVRSSYRNVRETRLTTANASGIREAYVLDTPGGVQGASAIAGGRAYVLAAGALLALDAATGRELWRNDEIGGSSSPTLADGVLYVHASFGGATLFAVDPATGAVKWRKVTDPHSAAQGTSSPVVADRYVLVGASSGEEGYAGSGATFRGSVVAFDRTSGDEVWRTYTVDAPHNGCSVWSTVSVDLDARVVFATTGNNYTEDATDGSDSFFALELDTGKERWHLQATAGDVFTMVNPRSPDFDFGANPILFEAEVEGVQRKLVGAGQKAGIFWALDRGTGEVVWQRKLAEGTVVGGVLNNGAHDGERILVATSNGRSEGPGSEPPSGETVTGGPAALFALDPATGDIVWERQIPAYVWAPITVANGVGFVATESRLQAFDTATGEKLAEYKASGTIASAPVVVDGRVHFGAGMTLSIFGTSSTKYHVLTVD